MKTNNIYLWICIVLYIFCIYIYIINYRLRGGAFFSTFSLIFCGTKFRAGESWKNFSKKKIFFFLAIFGPILTPKSPYFRQIPKMGCFFGDQFSLKRLSGSPQGPKRHFQAMGLCFGRPRTEIHAICRSGEEIIYRPANSLEQPN